MVLSEQYFFAENRSADKLPGLPGLAPTRGNGCFTSTYSHSFGSDQRLANGLMVRQATWEDDERLIDLFANSPERLGDWDVTVERSPNPYAQQRMHATHAGLDLFGLTR